MKESTNIKEDSPDKAYSKTTNMMIEEISDEDDTKNEKDLKEQKEKAS